MSIEPLIPEVPAEPVEVEAELAQRLATLPGLADAPLAGALEAVETELSAALERELSAVLEEQDNLRIFRVAGVADE